MDLPWGDERTRKFVTNVGLITSDGPNGPDIMACEWTHHISYTPGLIAIVVKKTAATNANIKKTKEFGVNLTSTEQMVMSSIAGGSTGKDIDKIAALKELGFSFYNAKKIKTVMVEGAALNIECTLVNEIELHTHTMFIGEVVETHLSGKASLAFHGGKYWKLSEQLPKPSDKERDHMTKVIEKHTKK